MCETEICSEGTLWFHFLYQMFLPDRKTFHQPAVLLRIHAHHLVGIARPLELSIFQPLVQQQEPIAFPQQSFDAVCSPAAEQKHGSFLEWIQMEPALYDGCKSIDPQAKISVPTSQIHILILISIQIVQHVLITSKAVLRSAGVIWLVA